MRIWRDKNELLIECKSGMFVLDSDEVLELRKALKTIHARGWAAKISDEERARRSERMRRVGHLGRAARKAKAAARRTAMERAGEPA